MVFDRQYYFRLPYNLASAQAVHVSWSALSERRNPCWIAAPKKESMLEGYLQKTMFQSYVPTNSYMSAGIYLVPK